MGWPLGVCKAILLLSTSVDRSSFHLLTPVQKLRTNLSLQARLNLSVVDNDSGIWAAGAVLRQSHTMQTERFGLGIACFGLTGRQPKTIKTWDADTLLAHLSTGRTLGPGDLNWEASRGQGLRGASEGWGQQAPHLLVIWLLDKAKLIWRGHVFAWSWVVWWGRCEKARIQGEQCASICYPIPPLCMH